MGGGMKGHGSGGYYSNSRNRSYMLMVLIAFGAAIFGVMLLHKLRERRIFNLLAQQKDHQIFSLQLLLQKEREQAQEAKTRIEEMKVKLYNVRTEKAKLNSMLSEMQSTISSLKDERRALELAFQDMQNEAKLLRQKLIELNDQNPQVIALSKILRQKEAEIDDLKRHLELPAKVWSVSTDDPSISSPNVTATGTNITVSGKIKVNEIQDENGSMDESTNNEKRENVIDDASKHRDIDEERTEDGENGRERIQEEKSENMVDSQDNGFKYGKIDGGKKSASKDAADVQNLEISLQKGEKRKGEKESKITSNDEQKPRDKDSEIHSTDGKELGAFTDFGFLTKFPGSQGGDNEEISVNRKGGIKLEMKRNFHNGRYILRGKQDHLKRTKGNRGRTLIKHHIESKDGSDSNRALKGKPDKNKGQNMSFRMNESTIETHKSGLKTEIVQQVRLEQGNIMLPDHVRTLDGEEMSQKVEKVETYKEAEKELKVNVTARDGTSSNQNRLEKPETNGLSQGQETIVQQHIEDKDHYEGDDLSGKNEVVDKNDVKTEDVQETRSATNTFTKLTSNLEEDGEEEDKDEPEF